MVQVPCVDLCTDMDLLPPHVTLSTLLLLALLKLKSLSDDTTGCVLQNRIQPSCCIVFHTLLFVSGLNEFSHEKSEKIANRMQFNARNRQQASLCVHPRA